MAYYIHLKDGTLIEATRKSDFPDKLASVDPDKINRVFEGQEVNFRFQSVPVVSRPEPKRKRKKTTE